MPTLLELALDGNPLALEPSYRASILELSRSIRHLDLRRVSDEERRAAHALARKEGERQAERERKERELEERATAIRAAARGTTCRCCTHAAGWCRLAPG